MGVVETLAIGGALAGMATSVAGAVKQNKAVERSLAEQNRGLLVEARQQQDAAALEKSKAVRNAELVRARLRVASAAAGVGMTGSYEALDRQAVNDTAINTAVINRNLSMNLAALESRTRAIGIQTAAQGQNALLAAIGGAVGGGQAGMSLGIGIDPIVNPPRRPPAGAAGNYARNNAIDGIVT